MSFMTATAPYFAIGTGHERVEHVSVLEAMDERLDASSRPEDCFVHGSLLAEMADIYGREDTSLAREALAKSDVMYYVASGDTSLAISCGRELAFNSLRRSLLSRTVPSAGCSVRRLASLGAELPAPGSFHEDAREHTGLRSELLAQTLPLAVTANRPTLLPRGEHLVGWPSYVRQDRLPGAEIDPRYRNAYRNPRFDMRLSTYRADWTELRKQRQKVQVKTGDAGGAYAPDITVLHMNRIGQIHTPRDARAFFSELGQPPAGLYTPRRNRLERFENRLLRRLGVELCIT
jgi:hypothetical protein